jgi:hypothetical protein
VQELNQANALSGIRSRSHVQISARQTLLTWAIEAGRGALCELLLQSGVSANGEDGGHLTPLCWATKCKDLKIFRLLLEHGADLKAWGSGMMGPVFLIALQMEHAEIV